MPVLRHGYLVEDRRRERLPLWATAFTHLLWAGGHIGPSPSSPGERAAFGRRCAAAALRFARTNASRSP
jgi:hypothetical protein